jgi:hypothetical protein
VSDQLQGVKQGIREAQGAGKISADQARDLMQQADTIQHAGSASASSMLGQINQLDQRLQNATGQGTYIGSGGDGGYYPNGCRDTRSSQSGAGVIRPSRTGAAITPRRR